MVQAGGVSDMQLDKGMLTRHEAVPCGVVELSPPGMVGDGRLLPMLCTGWHLISNCPD